MNSGLCIYDLSPECREALIARTLKEMRKTFALWRMESAINSLPAAVEVTPSSSSAVAGASLTQV